MTFIIFYLCVYSDKFTILACHDGRYLSWGRNENGQLGNGQREHRDKPRQSPSAASLLQVFAGAEHVVALTTDGSVITWGANRKGQLGITIELYIDT